MGDIRRIGDVGFQVFNVASMRLPPDPASVPAARQLVHDMTAHLPRRAREAAELVASELATNSIVHARTDFEVFACVDDATVEVLVADGTGWSTGTEEGGRAGHGLLLVGLLASDWTAQPEGPGKRVWARLTVDDVPAW